MTGEQCANKWKKLEEKFKKVKEHNAKTGSERRECDFQEELAEFFASDPKIIPPATVSTLSLNASVDTTEDVSTDDEGSSRTSGPPKKKKKRR